MEKIKLFVEEDARLVLLFSIFLIFFVVLSVQLGFSPLRYINLGRASLIPNVPPDEVTYESNATIPLKNQQPITSVVLSGTAALNSQDALVRVLLVDDKGNEYLVYETNGATNEINKPIVLDNVCYGTCQFGPVAPATLKIQITHGFLKIKSLETPLSSGKSNIAVVKINTEAPNPIPHCSVWADSDAYDPGTGFIYSMLPLLGGHITIGTGNNACDEWADGTTPVSGVAQDHCDPNDLTKRHLHEYSISFYGRKISETNYDCHGGGNNICYDSTDGAFCGPAEPLLISSCSTPAENRAGASATFTARITGGISPYNYTWSGPATTIPPDPCSQTHAGVSSLEDTCTRRAASAGRAQYITVESADGQHTNGGYPTGCDFGVSIPVTGITVVPVASAIPIRKTQQFIATVTPANATNKNVVWESSNPAVAEVFADNPSWLAHVNAIAPGRVKITATAVGIDAQGNHKFATSSVFVIVGPNDILLKFTAKPSIIDYNQSTTLAWDAHLSDGTTRGISCKLYKKLYDENGTLVPIKNVVPKDTFITPKLSSRTRYTISCHKDNGPDAQEDVNVEVLPSVTLKVAGGTGERLAGSRVTLFYAVKNASRCEPSAEPDLPEWSEEIIIPDVMTDGNFGNVSSSITFQVMESRTYKLSCNNSSGDKEAEVKINVRGNPTEYLPVARIWVNNTHHLSVEAIAAINPQLNNNLDVAIDWRSFHTADMDFPCQINGKPVASRGAEHDVIPINIAGTYRYEINCSGEILGTTASDEAVVVVSEQHVVVNPPNSLFLSSIFDIFSLLKTTIIGLFQSQ